MLDRRFEAARPNQAWVSDITLIRTRTRSGWLYLAAVLDLHSRKLAGWAMAPNMPAERVCTALHIPTGHKWPFANAQPVPGLVVHSDRGSQYASEGHRRLLEKHGLTGGMGRNTQRA